MNRQIIIRSILGMVALAMLWQGCDTRVPEQVSPDPVDYTLKLSSNRYLLYADHGRTIARITAQLLNEDGEPIQGATINFSTLQGVISGMVNTDISGRAVALYNDNGLSGDSVMVVGRYTDNNNTTVRDTVYLTVLPMEALVHNFFTGLDPVDGIVEVQDKVDSYFATVKSYIRDSSGVAVTNVAVNYKVLNNSSIGFLDNSVDSTDSQGISRIKFYNNPGDTGVVRIACYITGPELQAAMERNNTTYHFNPMLMKGTGAEAVAFTDTVSLYFQPIAAYSLTLSTSRDSIFADNGETTASIKAALKTTDGRPIVDERVNFSTTLGAIESPVNTNSSGVAISTLTDVGPSDIGMAQVVARAEHPFFGSQRDTVSVRIRTIGESGQPWPYSIRVVSTRDTIFADNGNTIALVQAVVKDAEDQPLDSVRVQFTASKGVLASPIFTNTAGVAGTEFYSLGVQDDIGDARIKASYTHPVHGTIRDTVYVYVAPNPVILDHSPAFIDMVPEHEVLPPIGQDSVRTTRIFVSVTDTSGYPVDQGTLVEFSSTLGYITPFASTNTLGQVVGTFSMGTSAGVARIYAETNGIKDSCLVQIRSGIPTSITIPQPRPNHIVVQGGSGSESTQLTAELRDANGQLVDLPYLVSFQIYGASPSGVRLNGQGLTASDSSNHGVAAVTLNSGTQSGGVRIRASVDVNGTIISASSNSVVIEAGPPYYIFPDYDPQNIEDIGGGMYELELSARVQDYYTNPVEDSTHVYWYAVPNNAIDIIGTSYTNNENKGGDAYKGLAWTKAYYNSEVIFEQVQIIARTFDGDGNALETPLNYSTDSVTIMPYVPGQLSVGANPSFWDFGTMGNPAFVAVTAVLTDVYNSAIPRGHIMFSGVGVTAWFDAEGNALNPPIVETDQNGMAVAIAQFDQTLCTPNFDSQGNVTSYTPFTAYVWGSLMEPQQITSEQASIELRRSIPE
ncbi:MAG: Ig-like domain-containing protein [Lentisphaeria bacterium]|nr:Ig-like domain-containing protein [Lentisphaeria bacterium]